MSGPLFRSRSRTACRALSPAAVRAAARGDREALERVLGTLYTPVWEFLVARFNFAHDPEDICKDLAQESLLRIARGLPGCHAESEEQFVAWALTVARNVGLNYVHHLQVELAILSEDAPPPYAFIPEPGPEVNETDVGDRIAFRLLTETTETLPGSARDLLWAHLVDRLPWSVVGEEFGTTPDGAKRRFQRLQHRLRKEMLRRIAALPDSDRRQVLDRLFPPGTP